MKNMAPVMNGSVQNKALDWLYQEEQGEDFLLGKTPQDFQDSWEDEE